VYILSKFTLVTGGARCGKSRFAELLAAHAKCPVIYIATAQIWDEEMALRQNVAERYTKLLNEAGVYTSPHIEPCNTSAWAQYTIRVQNRDEVQEALKQAGIPTAVHYPIPLNKQPAVADTAARMPVCEEVAAQVMSLPMSADLTDAQVTHIVNALTSCASRHSDVTLQTA